MSDGRLESLVMVRVMTLGFARTFNEMLARRRAERPAAP
jgi:hypothetical protein